MADLKEIASETGQGLLSDSLDARLKQLVSALADSIMSQAKDGRDSLLGEKTRNAVDSILKIAGERVGVFIETYRNSLLGDSSASMLQRLIKTALTDSLTVIVSNVRKQALGPESRASLDTLLQGAGVTIGDFFRREISPELRAQQSFLKKNAQEVVFASGGVITGCILVAAAFRRRRNKMRRLVEVLTSQINDIKSQSNYDELVGNIRKESLSLGFEPDLRQILTEQGILGARAWEPARINNQSTS